MPPASIRAARYLLGYFDHFLIRGFNAQIYQDGFSDGSLRQHVYALIVRTSDRPYGHRTDRDGRERGQVRGREVNHGVVALIHNVEVLCVRSLGKGNRMSTRGEIGDVADRA